MSQYYPPDFDPAKLPRGQKGDKNQQMKVSRADRARGCLVTWTMTRCLRSWKAEPRPLGSDSAGRGATGAHDAGYERAVRYLRQLHVQGGAPLLAGPRAVHSRFHHAVQARRGIIIAPELMQA